MITITEENVNQEEPLRLLYIASRTPKIGVEAKKKIIILFESRDEST